MQKANANKNRFMHRPTSWIWLMDDNWPRSPFQLLLHKGTTTEKKKKKSQADAPSDAATGVNTITVDAPWNRSEK
jgi:hypothetical protein